MQHGRAAAEVMRCCQTCRPHIFATFGSFRAVWREQAAFAAGLLGNLAADLRASAADLAVAPRVVEPALVQHLRRLVSLAGCIAAIAQACGDGQAACVAGARVLQLRVHGRLVQSADEL